MIYNSTSTSETFAFAKKLGQAAQAGEVYCLTGELGAGKTVFAKGFAKGLGITDDITSPTFCILNEYSGRLLLYHFDVYRINNLDEMDDIGYIDYFGSNGICLVEWGEMIKPLLPATSKFIKITKHPINTEHRSIEIT